MLSPAQTKVSAYYYNEYTRNKISDEELIELFYKGPGSRKAGYQYKTIWVPPRLL